MDEKDIRVLLLTDGVGLLLGCLRNYLHTGDQVDLDGALAMEPEVAALLAEVREMLPRSE
jgi:hypothetical protein